MLEFYPEIWNFEAYVQFRRLICSEWWVQSSPPPRDTGEVKTWSEACAIPSSASWRSIPICWRVRIAWWKMWAVLDSNRFFGHDVNILMYWFVHPVLSLFDLLFYLLLPSFDRWLVAAKVQRFRQRWTHRQEDLWWLFKSRRNETLPWPLSDIDRWLLANRSHFSILSCFFIFPQMIFCNMSRLLKWFEHQRHEGQIKWLFETPFFFSGVSLQRFFVSWMIGILKTHEAEIIHIFWALEAPFPFWILQVWGHCC